jgi:hypothetical protein
MAALTGGDKVVLLLIAGGVEIACHFAELD